MFDFHSFMLPTREASERLTTSQLENAINRPSPLGASLWKFGFTPEGRIRVEHYLDGFPMEATMRARLLTMLGQRPEPGGRLLEALKAGGGLLNLFNPWPSEADDERWPALVAKAGSTEAAIAGGANLKWNATPNEVLASLTPAQVWAGTGKAEAELIITFLRDWTAESEHKTFHSHGEMLLAALRFLRHWQCVPQGNLTPEQRVRIERDETLRWKSKILGMTLV